MIRLITALLVAGLVGCSGAGSSGAVAMVDVNAVARALGRDDVIEQQIQSANHQLTTQLLQVAQSLQQQLEAQQQSAGEDEAAREQLAQATAKANQQLKKSQRAAQQQLDKYRAGVVGAFLNEVRPHAEEIARARHVRLVLTASSILWFDPAIDITDEVIAAMRADAAAPTAPSQEPKSSG